MRQVEQIRDQHSFRLIIKEVEDDFLICQGTLPDGKKNSIKVSKPYALRTTPFNGRTITYSAIGEAGSDLEVSYAYVAGSNYNKRVASYPIASTRCTAADHIETIFPPYEVGDPIVVSLNTVGNLEDTISDGKLQLDDNRDGRHWQDDCGTGGGGGTSVWV